MDKFFSASDLSRDRKRSDENYFSQVCRYKARLMRGKPLGNNDTNDDEGNNASLVNLSLVFGFLLTFQVLTMTFMTFLTISNLPFTPQRERNPPNRFLFVLFCNS